MAELIAQHTGQTVERITADFDRDRWFSAQEAKDYGFVDHVISRAGQLPDATSRTGTGAPDELVRAMPQSRYVLPSFVERTSYGVKESNPYNKLFEERIIFLGVQIDDASANDVMAQLLVLESTDPDREIMHVHQLAGWLVHLADGDLRHDAVRPAGHPDGLPRARPRRPPRCCSPRARPASGSPCRTPGS